MNIRNANNGQILRNILLIPTIKVYSSSANESEVESVFEEFLKDIGYGEIGNLFTKRVAKSKRDSFVSKTGNGNGYPDYIFYDDYNSEKIIAIGDVKKPDPKGGNNSKYGISDCIDIYLKNYNKKHKSNRIRICFSFDGFNFLIKYLNNKDEWVDIMIDNEPITTFPPHEMLVFVSRYGNIFTTSLKKDIEKEILEPYFAQCDAIFRTGKSSLSAIDKASEISIFIFLKIFSKDKYDEEFIKYNNCSVWEAIEKGNVTLINKTFKEFLNGQYQNVFPDELIKVDSQITKDLASVINNMFEKCSIDRMTDVKGNALEYYQKDSKDRKIGEFFTPRHIIEMINYLVNPTITFKKNKLTNEYILDKNGNRQIEYIEKIYDPTCGSGGFLISAFLTYIEKYSKYGVTNLDLKKDVIFGNELKDTTVMLTKLNMILLGDGHNHISNENALGYKKIHALEKIKDKKGNYIVVDEEDIIYEEEFIGYESVSLPYDKETKQPLLEESGNIKYYLATKNNKGKLIKLKKDGKYIQVSEENVLAKINEKGEEIFFEKNTNNPILKTGKREHKFYKAKIKYQKDKNTPVFDYIDINPVNPKIREYHKDFFGKFDIVMANHPYALEEPKKPDELFIRHMLESIKKGGRIACIVSESLLFKEIYEDFRKWCLDNITIEAIISLPQCVFSPYTDVKTSILLLKKEKSPKEHLTWLVDIQKDGYELNSKRNPTKENDIPRVKNLWEKWGGYFIEDENGNNVYKSFHKQEPGFAEFHKLQSKNWCVKRYNASLITLNSKYELYPINKVLTRVKEIINIEDSIEYKQITVKTKNGGVFLRECQKGSEIGTKKQFIVRKGQFIISKIDARNGAYGIIPEDLDGAIITGNFWTYSINTNLVTPEYLTRLMRHDFFLQMCNVCSYGSTNRWYLDEDTFNNFEIPIPKKNDNVYNEIKKHLKVIEDAQKIIKEQDAEIMHIIDSIVYGK